MIIALIKERKNPPDNRVALSPVQCVTLKKRYPQVEIWVESSENRCFSDEDYIEVGISVKKDVSDADVFLGIKEVPVNYLTDGKTFLMFSHTIKKQPYNQKLLQAILSKKIRLIDYEVLKWESGQRVVGFGRWAGIVGAYNGLMVFGKRNLIFNLKPAYKCLDFAEVISQVLVHNLPPIKIVVTGGGRVAKGAVEFLKQVRIREVTPQQYLNVTYDVPVFTQLNSPDLYVHPDKNEWDSPHFYEFGSEYQSQFLNYARVSDLIINGIYWNESLPRLFEKSDLKSPEFKPRVIADISCDVNGSVPITVRATSIDDPVLGWNIISDCEGKPLSLDGIDVMAVGNLPNELPRDASHDFGAMLLQHVIPELLEHDSQLIDNATIANNGFLTIGFQYLRDYVDEKG
jgi:saccharopine dehydrogenase (NAD+, L-lysine-forming)